jgi:hypothetical protein
MKRITRHMTAIKTASGVFLIGIGVLIALGRLQQLNGALISWGVSIQQWEAANPAAARLVLGLATILIGLAPSLIAGLRRMFTRSERARIISVAKGVFLSLFVLVGVFQLVGWINLAGVLHSWLTFQGI